MKDYIFFWLTIILLNTLFNTRGLPQNTGIIKGTVQDVEYENITGAGINLIKTNMGAVTDANGKYLITNVPFGFYEIRCSFAGYKAQIDTIELSSKNPEGIVNFFLATTKDKIPGLEPFYNDTTIYLYSPITMWDGRIMLQREELTDYKKNESIIILNRILDYLKTNYFNKESENEYKLTPIELNNFGLKNIKTGSRDYTLAIVNIDDKDSVCMTRYFQGTAGGYTTFLMIVANILQPQLDEAMIDGLIVLYNNKELEELSHINLSGIITYKEIKGKVSKAYNYGF